MRRFTLPAALSLAAVAAMLSIAAAEAAPRGRHVQVQGPGGRGYMASRHADRTATSFSGQRSVQTNSGAGFNRSRNATYGQGAYSGASLTTFNNGRSISRSASAHDNGNGTASLNRTVTGSEGGSKTVSRTVPYSAN